MKIKSFFILLFMLSGLLLQGQQIRINVRNKPLDVVLTSLGVQISFDSESLSRFDVKLDTTFNSPRIAIDFLLQGKPFLWEKVGNVYVIFKKDSNADQFKVGDISVPDEKHIYRGRLIDAENGEGLPYGHIVTSDGYVVTDESGQFVVKREIKSTVSVKASYIGYSILDTMLNSAVNILKMKPVSDSIPGVMISAVQYAMLMQSGLSSGEYRINHHIARYMPGSSDNSVFTLLRMMPGVRASNEPSADLIIWGGQSRVTFDGFTLYGMRGFNDNISFVNPYMVKDIRLRKGGYGVSVGGHAGAIAEINGNDGNRDRPVFKANIGTLTANVYGSIPVNEKAALSVAYRQTFYHLYSSEFLNPYNGNRPASSNGRGNPSGDSPGNSPGNPSGNVQELVVYPDYAFRDINLKYSSVTEFNNNYYVSLYGADDKFSFNITPDEETEVSASVHSRQMAGAAGFNKLWKSGSVSKISLSLSSLSDRDENITISPGRQTPEASLVRNSVSELGVKLNHSLPVGKVNNIELGVDFSSYSVVSNNMDSTSVISAFYLSDRLNLGRFSAEAGLRTDFSGDEILFLPRISLSQKMNDFNVTASWGLYTQYMNREPMLFPDDRISYVWQLNKPVRSMHTVAGIAYNRNGILISTEGFFKKSQNITELIEGEIATTNIDIFGVDLFLKKTLGAGSVFGSYSFQKIIFPLDESAHEIKAGGIYGFKNFVFTANYVYGNGYSTIYAGSATAFPGSGQASPVITSDKPYSRLDLAATYRLKLSFSRLQTGISVLNLLNSQNVKHTYLLDSNDPVTLYSKAITITPMLFVEFIF